MADGKKDDEHEDPRDELPDSLEDEPLDKHPDPGQFPSDVDVQAERQPDL